MGGSKEGDEGFNWGDFPKGAGMKGLPRGAFPKGAGLRGLCRGEFPEGAIRGSSRGGPPRKEKKIPLGLWGAPGGTRDGMSPSTMSHDEPGASQEASGAGAAGKPRGGADGNSPLGWGGGDRVATAETSGFTLRGRRAPQGLVRGGRRPARPDPFDPFDGVRRSLVSVTFL